MPDLLADVNFDGHFRRIEAIFTNEVNRGYWLALGSSLRSFRGLGWNPTLLDDEVWVRCQTTGMILVTANRDMDRPDSLEATLRRRNRSDSLPVFTLSDAGRFLADDPYAHRVADRFLNYLDQSYRLLGAGRLYLP